MRARSLLQQAIGSVLVVELLCAVAFTSLALLHERRVRVRGFDEMLQGRSDSLLGAIQDAEDPNDTVAIDRSELALPAGDVYAVYNRGGRLLGSSSDAPPGLIERRSDGFSTRRANGHHFRVLEREGMRVIDRAESQGVGLRRPVTIVYAARNDRIWHEVLEAARFYVILSVLLIAGTAIIMIVLVRRVFAPLGELAVAAAAVSARSLEFRPPGTAMLTRELRPLAMSLEATVTGLRHAFEAEQRFVGDAAHELKTAVAVVRSSVQVMMMRPRPADEYVAGLGGVLGDTARLEALVTRMLTLASFEAETALDSAPVDLVEASRLTVERLRSLAEASDVTLALEAADQVWVRISAEKAEVLVSNLVVNAIQHSARASRVEVMVDEREGRAVLRVRDQGHGISAEALPHVFERFYREDRSRSRETGGAGLGLAISKSIVEAAHGTIEIDSAPDSGTRVTVELPRVSGPMSGPGGSFSDA